MTEPRHYLRAPISEAVIDLRVTPSSGTTLETLADIRREIAADFPTQVDKFIQQAEISQAASGIQFSAGRRKAGYMFSSSDGRNVLQAQLESFTFSRLAPYETWQSFSERARHLWQLYRSVVVPESIQRLAVRYINRLDLPLPLGDFNEYLLTVPEVAPGLPQALNSFFMRLEIPQPDGQMMLFLQQATATPPADEHVVSIILDIDLFVEQDLPQDNEAIWQVFERLHIRKNEIFEACITDQTRELID